MTRDLLEQAAKALEIAQRWLANSMPTVELDGPKPLPIIAAARTALLAELAREPWTREVPTVPGYWWFRQSVYEKPYIEKITARDIETGEPFVGGGEWSGPILCPAAPVIEGGAK